MSLSRVLATFLLLILRADGFSCVRGTRSLINDAYHVSSWKSVHTLKNWSTDKTYYAASFPSRITSFKNHLCIQLNKKIKLFKPAFLSLFIALSLITKTSTSVFASTKAVSLESSPRDTRTVRQEKMNNASAMLTVIIAAVIGTVLGKNTNERKDEKDEDVDVVLGTINETSEIVDTTNITPLPITKPSEDYKIELSEDREDIQRKRRIAANRRVKELLATSNVQKSTMMKETQGIDHENAIRDNDNNLPAPMSGWAGYKHPRWGGYLDNLNANKENQSQDTSASSSSNSTTYVVESGIDQETFNFNQSDAIPHKDTDMTMQETYFEVSNFNFDQSDAIPRKATDISAPETYFEVSLVNTEVSLPDTVTLDPKHKSSDLIETHESHAEIPPDPIETVGYSEVLTWDQSNVMNNSSTESPELLNNSEVSCTELDFVTNVAHTSNMHYIDDSAHDMGTFDFQEKSSVVSSSIEEQMLKMRENSILAEKYAAYFDIGERAFAILLDLGMIQRTPDIDDPSYDHSYDDEFAPENNFLTKRMR